MQINIILIVSTRQWQQRQLLLPFIFSPQFFSEKQNEINKVKTRDTASSIVARRMQMKKL